MLYNDKALGRTSFGARLAACVSILFRSKRYADLDLLSMNPHLRRDIGMDESSRGFRPDDIWRK